MKGSTTIHHFVTKEGEIYKGQIVWNYEFDLHNRPHTKEDEILYRVKLEEGPELWISNYEATIKCGRNANIYYELSEKGEQKIKKALGIAKHIVQPQI